VLRERGLSHEKSLRCASEGTLFGDGHKVTKLQKVHHMTITFAYRELGNLVFAIYRPGGEG
jgi:hypothetical protein